MDGLGTMTKRWSMPRGSNDDDSVLVLRLSGSRLALIVGSVAAAVGTFFTVTTTQSANVEKRLARIEAKLELIAPTHAAAK